jgi:hypothetical protein
MIKKHRFNLAPGPRRHVRWQSIKCHCFVTPKPGRSGRPRRTGTQEAGSLCVYGRHLGLRQFQLSERRVHLIPHGFVPGRLEITDCALQICVTKSSFDRSEVQQIAWWERQRGAVAVEAALCCQPSRGGTNRQQALRQGHSFSRKREKLLKTYKCGEKLCDALRRLELNHLTKITALCAASL